jgi:hypothetical protein
MGIRSNNYSAASSRRRRVFPQAWVGRLMPGRFDFGDPFGVGIHMRPSSVLESVFCRY